MKYLPNILSLSRIVLSLLLIYIATLHRPTLFVSLYAITALTDMLDGMLARKFKWQSDLGAKLDGFADVVLVISMLVIVLWILEIRFSISVLVMVGFVALLKAVNISFTRIKFQQWGTLHTALIRYTAIPFFLVGPLLVWTGHAWNALAIIILIAVLIAEMEETLILAISTYYDMNIKTVWHAKQKPRGHIMQQALLCRMR
ncbi:MAG: CDP-alcohol phosphatidyltransferase family protein [Oscillospiraceae bacterium]|nr:CDP-alcohol phosphatidyltransferase family protein [Oscillospiraceae bacterium]